MRTVCVILSFIILAIPNPIELAIPHKEDAVHPFPIILNLTNFEGVILSPPGLRRGIWYAGTHKEMGRDYIIGVIQNGYLSAILAFRAYRYNNNGRVKVRIDGNVANMAVPIPKDNPLNDLFYKRFGPENIRAVEIPD